MADSYSTYSFAELLSNIVDNRGKTCPVDEDGLPLIATNCVKNDTLYPVFEKVRYVNRETYEKWFRGHPEPGDVIFVCKGSPGNVCLTPDPVSFCIAQDMVAIRANEEIVDPKYLFALLRSKKTQAMILNMHVGTLIPHFKKGDFKNLYFDILNDKGIQKAIGAVYYTFSEKIELNRQMNATLESMAQALFKSWFVDFDPVIDNALAAGNSIPEPLHARAEIRKALGNKRKPLPEAVQKQFPSSFVSNEEIGWIPEGWKVTSIYNLVDIINGAPFKSKQFNTESVGKPIIRIRDLKTGIPQMWSNEIHSKGILITAGSVIAGMDAEFRATLWPGDNGFLNQRLFLAKPLSQEVNSFFVQMVLAPLLSHEEHSQVGTTVAHLGKKDIDRFIILLPNKPILKVYSEMTNASLSYWITAHRETKTLTQLRDTLLPKLLSGQLCIPDAEKIAAGAV
jgi:type I restriction enzyme, S subunit